MSALALSLGQFESAGQAHDGQIADTLLDHPVRRVIVLADKVYGADHIP